MKKIEILGLSTLPEIKSGGQLGEIITNCTRDEAGGIREKDIIIITSKVVSKAENRIITLGEVKPGKKALGISEKTGKDATKVQLLLNDRQEIVAVIPLSGLAEKFILRSSKSLMRHVNS